MKKSSPVSQECASDVANSINTKIYSRNLPSHYLAPQFSMRPMPTQYVLFPLIEPCDPVPHSNVPVYNIENVFNPGSSAPWSGFAQNINTESILRNQIFALQRCSQPGSVASSTGDFISEFQK